MIVKIVDVDEQGNGIGKINGKTVFVKDAVYGESCFVEVTKEKKNFLEAVKGQTIEKSSFECQPFCEHFFECGGCTIQNLTYETQMGLKKSKVENHIQRIGKCDKKVDRVIKNPQPQNYRNKMELKMQGEKIGYYQKHSHHVIEIFRCPIVAEPINAFLPFLRQVIQKEKLIGWDRRTDQGLVKNITIRTNQMGELQFTLTVGKQKDLTTFFESIQEYPTLIESYLSINTNRRHEMMQECTLQFRKKMYMDHIGNSVFRVSPRSFFQVNRYNTENLYREAAWQMQKSRKTKLMDLYVGIGTTSIYLSHDFQDITGVEILEEAVQDANYNKTVNHVENVHFVWGKSEDKIRELLKEDHDIVLVDPPRKGLDEQLIHILGKSKIQAVCYISCNSATMARDIRLFQQYGFIVEQLAVCDMFSHTMHVECVALMSKAKE